MKKRLLFVLILTLVFILLATMQVYAAQREGTYSDNISWSYQDDNGEGVLTIHGTGVMENVVGLKPWESRSLTVNKIIIEEGITGIGAYVLNSEDDVVEIELPIGFEEIGNSAFSTNYKLSTVILPDGLKTIGSGAFSHCRNLVNIEIPKTVKTIGEGAFSWCESLSSISIPEGVTKIEKNAFYGCKELKNVTLPTTLTEIGKEAFEFCDNLTTITIPEGVSKIDEKAFYGSGIESITIPCTLKEVERDAFGSYNNLTDVYYNGDISQWNKITIAGGNSNFERTKLTCSSAVSLNDAEISIPEPAYEYTGEEIKPEVSVQFDGNNLIKGKDYTVTYANNVKSGVATIVITGIGNFKDKKEINFEIYNFISWNECDISLESDEFTYTGKPVTPKATVKYKGLELKEGTDYSVKYEDNISTGSGKVIITGIGHCRGTATEYFNINKAPNSITTSKNTYTLNANGNSNQSFSLELKYNGGKLSFKSSENGVTVSSDGIVTIKKGFSGEADIDIYAEGDNYQSASKEVTVIVKKIDNSITTSKNTYKFKAKATKDRVFSLKTKAGGNISYSSNKYAVTVSDDGKVTIEKGFVGEAIIKIKASGKGYKQATHEVKVVVSKAIATKIKMPKTKKIGVGSTSKIEPTLFYDCEKLSGLKWSSSNKKVATITSKGEIKAKKKGTTTITCTLKNGKKYKCKVKVVKNEYVEQRYSTVSFSDDRYGDVKVEFLDAHYKGKTLIVNLALYNNRIFYAKKFDWIKFKVNYNYKTVKTCTKKNVKIKLGAYDKRKITVKIPMKKVYDLVGAESFYVYDDDYWYTFTY